MRILFVAPYIPAPGSGGRTRFTNLLSRVQQRHDVRVLCVREPDQAASELTVPGRVFEPPPPAPRPGGLKGKLRFYAERLDPLPQFAALRFDVELAAAIRETVGSFQPHVVQIETTEMGQYLRAIPWGPIRALDLQDVAHGWFERVRDHVPAGKSRWTMRWEQARTRRYDRAICRRAEAVFVPSDLEAGRVRRLAGIEPVEVANGVDTSYFAPESVREDAEPLPDRDRILFVGPLTYTANRDGLRWFVDEVLPLIRLRAPGAYVAHIGQPIDEDFGDRVRHLGRVADVRPWYARSRVSIVPVRIGSGTRYKILEAFAMRRTVVSTSVGAEGLGAHHGEHLLIGDDAPGFAEGVARLLTDDVLGSRLGDAGRALVESRFDWEPLVATMEATWSRLIDERLDQAQAQAPAPRDAVTSHE